MEYISATATIYNGNQIELTIAVNPQTWSMGILTMPGERLENITAQYIAEITYDRSGMNRKTISIIESQARGIWVLEPYRGNMKWMKYNPSCFRICISQLADNVKMLAESWLQLNHKGYRQYRPGIEGT